MSLETLRQDIINHFLGSYEDDYPVEWPNREINKPSNAPWLRFAFNWPEEDRAEIGRTAYTGAGLIMIQVFTPKGSGSKESLEICDTVSAIFRNQVVNNIVFDNVNFEEIGVDDFGWFQINLYIPFEIDLIY